MTSIPLRICPKCGDISVPKTCRFCGWIEKIEIPVTLSEIMKMSDREQYDMEEYYINTLINDTFDPKAKEHRIIEYEEQKRTGVQPLSPGSKTKQSVQQSKPKSKPVVTCPYCKSTNTRKIGAVSKAIDVGVFGLFALPKVGKQWRCADCHSEF